MTTEELPNTGGSGEYSTALVVRNLADEIAHVVLSLQFSSHSQLLGEMGSPPQVGSLMNTIIGDTPTVSRVEPPAALAGFVPLDSGPIDYRPFGLYSGYAFLSWPSRVDPTFFCINDLYHSPPPSATPLSHVLARKGMLFSFMPAWPAWRTVSDVKVGSKG